MIVIQTSHQLSLPTNSSSANHQNTIQNSNYKKLNAEFISKYTAVAEQLRQNPELSGNEEKTNQILTAELEKFIPKFNIHTFGDMVDGTNKSKYGIIAKIEGNKPNTSTNKQALILTADMDTLPNNTDIAINGASHNCGHNVNMAALLATAEKLAKNKDNFSGEIFIIFTPAEESGGGFGEMIDKGLFENEQFGLNHYRSEDLSIITMHNNPMYKQGTISTRSGVFLCGNNDYKITIKDKNQAQAQIKHQNNSDINLRGIDNNEEKQDNLQINITGKGGHGGMPHEANTPILPLLNLIGALSSNPKYQNIQINNMQAGTGAFNIIPTESALNISISKNNQNINLEEFKDFVQNFCKISNCKVNFTESTSNIKASTQSIQSAKVLLLNLYSLVSQKTPAKSTNILSPTYISTQENGEIIIHGTSRFFENEHAQSLKNAINASAQQAKYYGDNIDIDVEFIQDSYPIAENTSELTQKLSNALIKLSKQQDIEDIQHIDTNADPIGGRDAFPFAFSKGKVKNSAYFFVGTRITDNEVGLHNTGFIGKAEIHIKTAIPAFLTMAEEVLA